MSLLHGLTVMSDMEATLQNLIRARSLTLRLCDPEMVPGPYPYIDIVRGAAAFRIPMPWKPEGLRQDPVGLLYVAMVTIQFYDECDDFLEWCDEHELDPSNRRALDDFQALGADIIRLSDMIGDSMFMEIRQNIAMGQAIGIAAS